MLWHDGALSFHPDVLSPPCATFIQSFFSTHRLEPTYPRKAIARQILQGGEILRPQPVVELALYGKDSPRLSGHQPSYHGYIPLFCKVVLADIFTIADDMAFGRQKFQHRQQIKSNGTFRWITVPVASSDERVAIRDKRICSEPSWRDRHWTTIQKALGDLPYFHVFGDVYERIYSAEWHSLTALNYALWIPLHRVLAPKTVCFHSTLLDFDRNTSKGDRVLAELKVLASGGEYVAGLDSQYLQSSSRLSPNISFADSIRREGYSISRARLDQQRFRQATSTSPTATAMELVAREGIAAHEILASCTERSAVDF